MKLLPLVAVWAGIHPPRLPRVNLSREFYAVIGIAVLAAGLLLIKAFGIKEPSGQPSQPPSREDELRAARAHAQRQIEILRNPVGHRGSPNNGEEIDRLQAIVTQIDAELKS